MKKITLLISMFVGLTVTTQAQNRYLRIDNQTTTSNRLRVSNSATTNVSASDHKTITFRIMMPVAVNTTNFNKIMLKSDNGATTPQYALTFGSSGTLPHKDIRLLAYGAGSTTNTGNTNNNSVASTLYDGAWHHFAVVLNDTDGKSRVYYDGDVLVVTTAAQAIDMSNNANLYFGATSGGGSSVNMAIDDIRIWDIAFSSARVTTDITASIDATTAPTTTNLIAAYDFDAGTATSIPDITGKVGGADAAFSAAFNNLNGFVTAPTTVNLLPTVAVTSPAVNASYVAPANVTITADAADADGSISKVEFFQGATKLGEALTAPYSFDWQNVALGSYAITAKATDNSGAVRTSTTVNITVTAALSTSDFDKEGNNVAVYPNPVQNNLFISAPSLEENATISVYNLLGNKLRDVSFTKGTQEVFVGDLQVGTYFVVIENGKQTLTKKFIKN
ncbi:Ig-like domain-containing protein [Flavobacterium sp. WC2509]|uniref:Ig-like domain-containing protein n=1 Tax=Flavobacterium sp. WC2509 TaxID=3461406 RepID=UPI0040449A9F